MNNRDLLKEAIADAKAVKETAIANAKAALEEAFTPYLKEKLAAKLSEMDDMEEAEDKKLAEIEDEKKVEENFDMDESAEMDEAESMDEADEMEEGKDLDEMDLDELLRELDEMEEGEKEEMMEGEEDLINDPKGPTAKGNVAEEEEEAGEAEGEEDEEIDLENMTEDDLKSFIESVIADMVAAGTLEGEVEGEEGEEGEGEEMEASEEEEINIDELVAELAERKKYGGNKGDVPAKKRGDKKDTAEEEGVEDYKKKKIGEIYDIGAMAISDAEAIIAALSALVGVPAMAVAAAYAEDKIRGVKDLVKGKKAGAMKEEGDVYEAEVDEMEEKLKEAYSTIETIKADLNEVNLLNAKLLYTNKIFRSKNLTESQKVKVLEAFDKASTAKEAKLVFETLSNEPKTRKSSVTESMIGGASKAAGIAPTKSPILEVNDQFARWQHLAGITK